MILRPAFNHGAQLLFRRQCCARILRRGPTASISTSSQYECSDVSGVHIASRDLGGPTAVLALVAKAGTRYEPFPGLSQGLEKFAFKGTATKSALRIVRESELLGSELYTSRSRETVVIGAKFLRADLPYFAELLGECATQTKFPIHTLNEEVMPLIKMNQENDLRNTKKMAIDSVYSAAFHRGLGNAFNPSFATPLSDYITPDSLELFGKLVYSTPNMALVSEGAGNSEISKLVEGLFNDMKPIPEGQLSSERSKYYGGEVRISHGSSNSMVLAFPGSGSAAGPFFKPEILVLATLLGGESCIKWASGTSLLAKATAGFRHVSVSTINEAYSDAGLFYIALNGSAKDIAAASREVLKAIKSVAAGKISKDDLLRAVARAKFNEVEQRQSYLPDLSMIGSDLVQFGKLGSPEIITHAIGGISKEQVIKEASALLQSKASVAAVGDLAVLPFAEEIGLAV